MAVQLGGKLDAADQFEPGRGSDGHRLVVALEGVVIRDAESGHAGAHRFRYQVARANNVPSDSLVCEWRSIKANQT